MCAEAPLIACSENSSRDRVPGECELFRQFARVLCLFDILNGILQSSGTGIAIRSGGFALEAVAHFLIRCIDNVIEADTLRTASAVSYFDLTTLLGRIGLRH